MTKTTPRTIKGKECNMDYSKPKSAAHLNIINGLLIIAFAILAGASIILTTVSTPKYNRETLDDLIYVITPNLIAIAGIVYYVVSRRLIKMYTWIFMEDMEYHNDEHKFYDVIFNTARLVFFSTLVIWLLLQTITNVIIAQLYSYNGTIVLLTYLLPIVLTTVVYILLSKIFNKKYTALCEVVKDYKNGSSELDCKSLCDMYGVNPDINTSESYKGAEDGQNE